MQLCSVSAFQCETWLTGSDRGKEWCFQYEIFVADLYYRRQIMIRPPIMADLPRVTPSGLKIGRAFVN
jgi:hypothetical protein